jgi:transcriptional regulator with XRE-family HTH domain
LRDQAGSSASRAAREVGISQSRISRIEAGLFLPTEEEITKLTTLYRAPAPVRRRLISVVKDLRAEETPARIVLQRGAWRLQRRIANIEADAAEICGFANNIVPGLLQTADYARVVFADGDEISPDEQNRAVAERLARSAIIEAGTQTIRMIMSEGALRWQAGSPQIMVEQLEHLSRLAIAARAQIGIISWTTPARTFPLHGFTMYDRRAVVIGTRSATAFITDPQDVAVYRQLFDELTALASYGAEAAQIIARVTDDYRGLTS